MAISKVNVVKAVFNPSAVVAQRATGTHRLGVYIPANAIITKTYYDVITTLASATDAATIALQAEAANDIVTATAISVGTTWDNVAATVAGIPVNAATAVKTTATRELKAVVASETLSAGKVNLFVEYVVSA